MNPFMAQQMGISQVPGVGYVEQLGALGDDSSVMMISGLGADPVVPEQRIIGQTKSVLVDMQKWYQAVPWWVWLLVAIGAISAGAYLFRNLKKVT
ncbi:MAG: hypothetical protein WC700_18275 [Gemmatimonadaceae bacterium]|jgi:hypothetical protein